jgi:hypothetical protein
MSESYWGCKIGPVTEKEWKVMAGADLPMRNAVNAAFRELLGRPPAHLASGWGFTTPSLSDEPRMAFEEAGDPGVAEGPPESPRADQEGDAGAGARVAAEVERLKRSVELEHEHVLMEQRDLHAEQATALAVFAERRDQLVRRREPLERFMEELRDAKEER